MKNKLVVLGICAGALVAVVGAGAAFAHGGGGRGFMKAMLDHRITEAEDLVAATPEQRKVIEGSRDAIAAKMKAHFEAHRAAREAAGTQGPPTDPHDIVRLLSADKIDEKALYAEIDARAEEMKAMAREIVPEVIKAHDVLTPAQRQKLAEHIAQRHEQMRERWGGHGHGGPGGPGADEERGGFGGPDEK